MLTQAQRIFLANLQMSAEELAKAIRNAADLMRVFNDRQYGSATGVTDDDLREFDLTLQSVGEYIIALQQLINWRDGNPVTQGNYGTALNKVRSLR